MNAPLSQKLSVQTTCPYCGVGCGVLATPDGQGGAGIAGDPAHPANFGRLCSKGSALGETLGLETRLLHPMVLNSRGTYARVSWDDALNEVVNGWRKTMDEHGPYATAFYLSGQLLTEDYYVANKLMKGFLGTANVDTNSRLCMASSVAGHRRAFGADIVPGNYEDLDQADLIILTGSNAAWCHPVLFQRMIKNRQERGAKIIVIDPRRTASADEADLFLPIAPGMDSVLFSALLVAIADRGLIDEPYVSAHTKGLPEALASARQIAPDLATAARKCGLSQQVLTEFLDLWLSTPKTVTAWSQGVNQSAQGTDKVEAIINCHLATGRIGKAGCGPLSLTGQPNAMGGREVGGLANMLAAHMNFQASDIDRVRRFWNAPSMASHEGLKAVPMFDAISRGEIRALWVMATNPAVSLPRADSVRQAMRGLDLFVVSEVVRSNDTLNCGAHILLPAAAWGEKDGTVTNSERRISRQRPFLDLPEDVRPDWWIICEVAKRLGFEKAFAFTSAAEIFAEHAALSSFENNGSRDFDLSGYTSAEGQYERMQPFQWPLRQGEGSQARLFAEGGFFTADKRAQFHQLEEPALKELPDDTYPLLLNTGRVRDQWHTMTRTGLSQRLSHHLPEPFAMLHPDDAQTHRISDGGFVRLTSRHGEALLRARVSEGQRKGEVFAPIHWTAETSSHGRVGALVQPATDCFSGQPELKATAISATPVHFAFEGFLLSRETIPLDADIWFSRVTIEGAHGALLATDLNGATIHGQIQGALDHCTLAEFHDEARDEHRLAFFEDERLEACLFLAPAGSGLSWKGIKGFFASDKLGGLERLAALSGQSATGLTDTGPLICACFGVSLNTIRNLIAKDQITSAEEIGAHLKAGTNCGSCLPELRRLIKDHN
ncbi:MAG: hypothetical protein RIQ68_53 [Pseudomonadota bacterium]|jgi:assimilatory nitrate reductase catalytic subunit